MSLPLQLPGLMNDFDLGLFSRDKVDHRSSTTESSDISPYIYETLHVINNLMLL